MSIEDILTRKYEIHKGSELIKTGTLRPRTPIGRIIPYEYEMTGLKRLENGAMLKITVK